jgi:hypothetical protein
MLIRGKSREQLVAIGREGVGGQVGEWVGEWDQALLMNIIIDLNKLTAFMLKLQNIHSCSCTFELLLLHIAFRFKISRWVPSIIGIDGKNTFIT